MPTLSGYVANDRDAEDREQIRRAVGEVRRLFEDVACRYDPDGFGVMVGVRSQRPEQLLREIKETAFRTYQFTGIKTDDDGRHWTWFRLR